MNFILASFVLVYLVYSSQAAKLPSYLKACSKSDPNLGECAKEAANKALPVIFNGDKSFKNSPLIPLHVDKLVATVGAGTLMNLTDIIVHGIDTIHIKDMKIDVEKQMWEVTADADYLTFLVNYKLSGRVLVLPVTGQGPGNVTMIKPDLRLTFAYDLINRKGKSYIQMRDPQMTNQPAKMYFQLDNLFNGDERLGPELNRFMNENWQEIYKSIGPPIADTINSVVTNVFNNYFIRIPYSEIFGP